MLELDIARALAILLAIGWHFNHVETGSELFDALLLPGRTFGWAGVDLFFVLSGFLVGGLLFREIQRNGSIDLKNFYLRRILRLWPVMYLFLFAMLISGFSRFQDFFWQIALNVQNYFRTDSATHLWSLAVEEQFYVIFSTLIVLLLKGKGYIFRLPEILITIILLSPLIRAIGIGLGASHVAIQQQTQYRFDAIAYGVLLAYYYQFRPVEFSILKSRRLIQWIILVIGVTFLSIFSKSSTVGDVFGYSVSALTSSALLLLFLESGMARFVPSISYAMGYVGLISYSLYIWHVPVGRIVEIVMHGRIPIWLMVVLQYVASIVVAAFVTRLIELPIMKLRDRLIPRRVPELGEDKDCHAGRSATSAGASRTSP